MISDLELKFKCLQCLEKEIKKVEEWERDVCYNVEIIKEIVIFQIKECERVMSKCNVLSFVLLMNLLLLEQ